MNLTELYKDLSYGKLSNLGMSMDGGGDIVDAQKPKILLAADEALLLLYSRFTLSVKSAWIQAYSRISNYHLEARFYEASPTSQEDYLYIKEVDDEEFTDDVIRVVGVYDKGGTSLPLNDDTQKLVITTPLPKTIRISKPITGDLYKVEYQAKHAPLLLATPEQEIYLPEMLYTALRSYVAYRIYSDMSAQGSEMKAAEHLGSYESICQYAIDHDLLNIYDTNTNNKFTNHGWV